MKLVVGLGNPGRKYEDTRHNVGFRVLDELARQFAIARPRAVFQGEVVEASLDGERVLLLKPFTYMNNSGASVRAASAFYKLSHEDLLVVCDDLSLPLTKLRFRARGSSGGQKGLEDVIRHLGTREFSRLRIGIGEPPNQWDAADYVLSKFNKEEKLEIDESICEAARATVAWVRNGVEDCMNRYN